MIFRVFLVWKESSYFDRDKEQRIRKKQAQNIVSNLSLQSGWQLHLEMSDSIF